MILRVGFTTLDFMRAQDVPKPVPFGSEKEALAWLKNIASHHPQALARFREYASAYSGETHSHRITDERTLEELAQLLYAKRLVVIAKEERSGYGKPKESSTSATPAFPLSQRSRREASSTSPTTTNDPATFDSSVNGAAQAAALMAAAAEGAPFCQECAKPKQAAAAGGN